MTLSENTKKAKAFVCFQIVQLWKSRLGFHYWQQTECVSRCVWNVWGVCAWKHRWVVCVQREKEGWSDLSSALTQTPIRSSCVTQQFAETPRDLGFLGARVWPLTAVVSTTSHATMRAIVRGHKGNISAVKNVTISRKKKSLTSLSAVTSEWLWVRNTSPCPKEHWRAHKCGHNRTR